MRIIVTSTGKDLSAGVDPRFGRARFFIAFETNDGSFEVLDNTQVLNAPSGAGIQAAENVARSGAKAVLTGHCGPKAFRALSAAGIHIYVGVQGTVGEAVERFKKGEYAAADGANVEGHWV